MLGGANLRTAATLTGSNFDFGVPVKLTESGRYQKAPSPLDLEDVLK
jgi:hypothetical protein